MNPNVKELPIEERIRLVEDVWDSIAADQGSLPLSKAHREELDRRLDAYRRDRDPGADASTVLGRIRNRL